MNGNKGKYFCLNLSFIGWMILSMLPVLLLPYFDGIAGIAADLVYSIPWYFSRLIHTADVTFYDLVTGNLVARPEDRLTKAIITFNSFCPDRVFRTPAGCSACRSFYAGTLTSGGSYTKEKCRLEELVCLCTSLFPRK